MNFELTLIYCLGEAKKRLSEVLMEVGLKEEENQQLFVRECRGLEVERGHENTRGLLCPL